MSTLYVHGMGHFHPENVISNRFLQELDIGTSDAWIMERVGIETRRTVLPHFRSLI
jgi:3-oxoacyl-[acyl-carrier-protein] synthase-3